MIRIQQIDREAYLKQWQGCCQLQGQALCEEVITVLQTVSSAGCPGRAWHAAASQGHARGHLLPCDSSFHSQERCPKQAWERQAGELHSGQLWFDYSYAHTSPPAPHPLSVHSPGERARLLSSGKSFQRMLRYPHWEWSVGHLTG